MTRRTTLEQLAAVPAWDLEEQLATPGMCRGSLLRDWAVHLRRRVGPELVALLRTELDIDEASLPDQPKAMAWFPVGYQVALTRRIVDLTLGADMLALEPWLIADATRARDRVIQLALRTIGPRRVLASAPKIHRHLYDVGEVAVVVGRRSATVRFSSARLFANPTWRVLQLFATRGMLAGFKRTITLLEADDSSSDGFEIQVEWK